MNGKKAIWIAVIILALLLFFMLKKKRRNIDDTFDAFFSDAEIINDFDEPDLQTPLPPSELAEQTDTGNGNTKCEQGGYMAFNFPNPTPNPITLNIVNPQEYYQTLNSYYASQVNTNTNYNIGSNAVAMQSANNLLYFIGSMLPSMVIVFDPENNSVVANIDISPNESTAGAVGQNSIIYGNYLIIAMKEYVTFVDINKSSPTYNQVAANIFVSALARMNNLAIFGDYLYVTCNVGLKGLAKINLNTLSLVSTFVLSTDNLSSMFPNYRFAQTSNRYMYLFYGSNTDCIIFDTFTDTVATTATVSAINSQDPVQVGNNLFLPQLNNIDVFDTLSNTVIASIATSVDASFLSYNGQSTVYVSSTSFGIIAIDTNSFSIITTVNTGYSSQMMILKGSNLYAADRVSSGIISIIDTNENSITYNQVTNTISTGLPTLGNPILTSSAVSTKVLFMEINSSSFSSSLIATTQTSLNDSISVNINNIQNLKANPGEICGIFYKSVTVAQMSNVLSVDYNDVLGMLKTYKLIPITYKDPQSILNQIYVSKFHQPIIINNNLNLYHVINPGENVYIKIYVNKYVSNVNMLETGRIEASDTKDSEVYGKEKPRWMTVEEVEEGEWDAVHIQCPEEESQWKDI